MGGKGKAGVRGDKGARLLAGQTQKKPVAGGRGETPPGQPRLPRPRELPRAAGGEIGLGHRKTVRGSSERIEPIPSLRGSPGTGQQEAVSRIPAAPDAPAKLVELGETEALGPLDEHHRGLGDVEADLDDGGRHEQGRRPAAKALELP